MNTNDFLNEVQRAQGLTSDYQLANCLDVTRSIISAYRHNKRSLGDETILKVAEVLELEPAYVTACIYAERARDEKMRDMWNGIARRYSKSAAAIAICAIVAAGVMPHSPDASAGITRASTYYVKYVILIILFVFQPIGRLFSRLTFTGSHDATQDPRF